MWSRGLFILLVGFSLTVLAENPQVEFETSLGNFVVELYPDRAPRTVENFLQYVNSGYYEGTVFDRAIPNFVAQGGGLTESLLPKPALDPIASESNNGLTNERGSIAMVHGHTADSATSRFFVNLADNRILNYVRHEQGLEGYTVFGRIVRGFDVLLQIGSSPTTVVGKLQDVPKELPVILGAHLLDNAVLAENLPPAPVPAVKESIKAKKIVSTKNSSSKLAKKGNTSGKTTD
jgi:cyclophilin family peptidyl-prolyl cis-trans isomerase